MVTPDTQQVTTAQFEEHTTTVREFAYESSRRELLVTFSSGKRYVYDNVPPEVVEAFKASAAKPPFFDREIRERFPHRQFDEQFLMTANGT